MVKLSNLYSFLNFHMLLPYKVQVIATWQGHICVYGETLAYYFHERETQLLYQVYLVPLHVMQKSVSHIFANILLTGH